MQKWMGFQIQVLFYIIINCVIWCDVTLTVLLKIEIARHIHSFVFHNEQNFFSFF